MKNYFTVSIAAAFWLCAFPIQAADPSIAPKFALAENGHALAPIVISADADAKIKANAADLARYLEKITGAHFNVETGDGSSGIVVGFPPQFPGLEKIVSFDLKDNTGRENYLLRSHPKGVYLLGATDLAIEHAVWDFLYRLGYRQFFPGEHWEIVPHSPSLSVAVDALERPSYYSRLLGPGFGLWRFNEQDYTDWKKRNRVSVGLDVETSHSYQPISAKNAAVFKQHPEWYSLIKGKRQGMANPDNTSLHDTDTYNYGGNFCVSNPALRQAVIDYAIRTFKEDPTRDGMSMDPCDGEPWCECEACQKLGTPSQRVLYLANEVADAVTKAVGKKTIGFYAYGEHSAPPGDMKVHPNVFVSTVTSYIWGGYTTEELIDGWRKAGATIAIREYYSVTQCDWDVPGQSRAADLSYLIWSIPHYYERGARFMTFDSSDNYGPHGLGYYLASRLLWNVNDAPKAPEIIKDFLDKSFGSAVKPMEGFYHLIDRGSGPVSSYSGEHILFLSDDLIGRMYGFLKEARASTQDAAVIRRVDDLIEYTHYLELYSDYLHATGPARMEAYIAVMKYTYRIGKTHMIASLGIFRNLWFTNKMERPTLETNSYEAPEEKNPWKDTTPIKDEERLGWLEDGIKNRQVNDVEARAFSNKLRLPPDPGLPSSATLPSAPFMGRGKQIFYIWVAEPGTRLSFKMTALLGADYRKMSGDIKVRLYPPDSKFNGKEPSAIPDPTIVLADGNEQRVELTAASAGLNRLEVNDSGAVTKVDWEPGLPVVWESSMKHVPELAGGRWSGFFYVPKSTPVIGVYADGPGELWDNSGKCVFKFGDKPGYFSIPVPPSESGKLWSFQNGNGHRLLMTVPPFISRDAKGMLLPEEVVEAQN